MTRRLPCGHSPPCGCAVVREEFEVECCVECPLPRCVYELSRASYLATAKLRHDEIAATVSLPVAEVATRLGISKRRVHAVRQELKGVQ